MPIIIYNLAMHLMAAIIKVASIFSPKARLFVVGRKNQMQRLNNFKPQKRVVWFHAASLGEFEQAKPVMEKMMLQNNDCELVVTFFSPSGYEIKKDYALATVFYLPIDTPARAQHFIEKINPVLAVFVRYELWLNYFTILQTKEIKTAIVAAQFLPNDFIFNFWGRWMLKVLRKLDLIAVQYKEAYQLLLEHNFEANKLSQCGDSRFDRVLQTVGQAQEIAEILQFKDTDKLLVLGSCYTEEINFVLPLLTKATGWKVILAPHNVDEASVQNIQQMLPNEYIRFSRFVPKNQSKFLILDTIGMLAAAYKYADIAVIGGGFKSGIHNILEPAAFGAPMFFGPNHERFPEAKMFIAQGFATQIDSKNLAAQHLQNLMDNADAIDELRPKIKQFMQTHAGATLCITEKLKGLLV